MIRRTGLGLLIMGALVGGCTVGQDDTPRALSPTTSSTLAAPATSAAPSASATPSAPPTPTATVTPKPRPKPHPISVQVLIERSYDGRDLRLGRQIGSTGAYRRYLISYRGDGLRLTGVMNVPNGKGPFPVLVLNHGYIDPDIYVAGQGMARENDYLARRGFVTLHIDYRNHAGSTKDPNVNYELRLPYVVDTINAVKAVKASKLDFLDRDRVGWLGRSMGGAVTLTALAVQPGLVDAAVVYASTSSLAADNWRQFNRDADDQRVNRRIERTYGLPDQSPEFWLNASPRPYLGRVTEPILVHHGLEDDTCPISWSRSTVRALKTARKDVTFLTYRGEGHRFEGQFGRSIARTADFFSEHLG
ncbi:MAG TPA: alpha/beta fold hydrolase [Propionibacteriaceae bacterium]|nr:alpha/beta fold hydrolase [Propionibacteriaceae bacterium]